MPRPLLLLPLLLLPLASASREDPADALREADRAFCRETREKGLAGWLAWFAPDAVVFPPAGDLAVGSAAVKRHYESLKGFPPAGFLWEPEQAGIASSGDLGWTIGRAGNDATGEAKWNGQYLTVWRKQPDGHWRVASDCTFDPRFSTSLTGLGDAPSTQGREVAASFRSSAGDLVACAGPWWASDAAGGEIGGKFLAVWRKGEAGAWELVAETGIAQTQR